MSKSSVVLASLIMALSSSPSLAADDVAVDDIIVTGRSDAKIGIATAASEGTLRGVDLELRPLLRTAEILESIPGMIVTQHSGGGKANQYFLRGYNLDHGTDFLFELDGVPMNLRTHAHGQGYLDLNGMISETIDRIDFQKGPYRADTGDFSLVGAARAVTKDKLEPFVTAELGGYGHRRLAAGGSIALSPDTTLVLAGDARRYDSPFTFAEKLRHYSGFAKLVTQLPFGTLRVVATAYDARWRPTDQIAERALGTFIETPFDSLDETLDASTSRQLLTASLDAERWRASAYVQRYRLYLLSNFTYFLDDPDNGDQIEQSERRTTFGGRVETNQPLSDTATLLAGGEFRVDSIPLIGLYGTAAGERIQIKNEYSVHQSSGGAYAEIGWRPVEQVTLTAGLRGDVFRFRSTALGGAAESVGSRTDSQLSPKVSVAWRPADRVEVYLNYGQGFHSNDARGVTQPIDPAPGLVRGRGYEAGTRLELKDVIFTGAFWWADVDSELVYVGDAGAVEPAGGSRRHGYEATLLWKPAPWLAIDLSYAGTHARFKDAPGADRIPLAVEGVGAAGFAAVLENFSLSGRLRYLGPKPLIEDNSVRGGSTLVTNFRAAYTIGRFEVFALLLNAFDSKDKDIEYYYVSRLPGEPLDGVADIHSRIVEPRMLRVGVTFKL